MKNFNPMPFFLFSIILFMAGGCSVSPGSGGGENGNNVIVTAEEQWNIFVTSTLGNGNGAGYFILQQKSDGTLSFSGKWSNSYVYCPMGSGNAAVSGIHLSFSGNGNGATYDGSSTSTFVFSVSNAVATNGCSSGNYRVAFGNTSWASSGIDAGTFTAVLTSGSNITTNIPNPYAGGVYVSPAGNDTNAGHISSPVRSFKKAIDIAVLNGVRQIYSAKGLYTNGDGLSVNEDSYFATNGILISYNCNNFKFSGGWDTAFTSRSPGDYSELDGHQKDNHIININGCSNVTIDGFIIRGGYYHGTYFPHGGGIYLNSAPSCLITNCVISNNSVSGFGGGIYIDSGSPNTIINAVIAGNLSGDMGGGIHIRSFNNTIGGTIQNNTALEGGGIFSFSASNAISADIIANQAQEGGGGLYIYGEDYSYVISGRILSNISADCGGGIYFVGAANKTINAVISGNTASNQGGGIFMTAQCTNNIINGTISGNYAGTNGGGVYMNYNAVWNTINGTIINNSAGLYGGGIYLGMADDTSVLNSIITNNWSGSNSSVICLDDSMQNLILSGNLIGGTLGSSSFGIYESPGGYFDVLNQVLVNNTFITNRLGCLYKNGAIFLSPYDTNEIKCDAGWTNINVPDYTGAVTAGGNKVTNL